MPARLADPVHQHFCDGERRRFGTIDEGQREGVKERDRRKTIARSRTVRSLLVTAGRATTAMAHRPERVGHRS